MATRTISASGGDRAWATTATWEEGAAPIAGDAVVARGDGTSGNVTIGAAAACASIILTNYTGTLTFNNTLTVTSTVTFPSGMTCAGTGDLISVTGATYTIACASGLTGGLRLGGTSQTYTLGSNWVIAGTLLFNGTTGFTLTGAFGVTAGAFSATASATSMTFSGLGAAGIAISGDAALSSATSTTFVGGTRTFQAATCTVSGGQTVTITSGTVTITGLTTSSTVNIFTGGTWNTGGLTVTGATTGTCVFNITGGTVTLTAALSCSMTLAAGVTWASATNLYAASGTPTLTISGNLTVGTSVLSIASSCTIVVSGGTTHLHDLTISAAATLTINTNVLIGEGTLTGPNAAVTFAGSAGFTFATLANTTISGAGRTYTLTAGNTYTCTTALNWTGASAALTLTVTSSHGTNKVAFILGPGASQDCFEVAGTRIDSSAGQTILAFRGTLTTCFNWITTQTPNIAAQYAFAQIGV